MLHYQNLFDTVLSVFDKHAPKKLNMYVKQLQSYD